jgi:nucleotide-binding universal stress UspA family protein
MNRTVLLAVDAARHVSAAAEMTRELSRNTGDKVIVLHVHEIAVGRFGAMRVDCAEGEGELLVADIVADLKDAGIDAVSDVREARYGHVSRKILSAADEHDARIIVVGSRGRNDVPHLPLGSVSHRLLHLARRPVLIVPRQAAAAAERAEEPELAMAAVSEPVPGPAA